MNALPDVTALLLAQTSLESPALQDLVQAQIKAGGKMLRARLLLTIANMGRPEPERLTQAAAAIEALHLATLFHDDVIDHAAIRRGVATTAAVAGNRAAIYAGDLMFAVYFGLLAEAELDAHAGASALKQVFAGELAQNATTAGQVITVADYLAQIKGKTAALFALATQTGAQLGHLTAPQQAAASEFGEALGMAFQIQDDLLDFAPDTGKPMGQDLKNGIYTLPVLLATQTHPELPAWLARGEQQAALALIQAVGVPAARSVAADYLRQAQVALHRLPAGEAREALLALMKDGKRRA